MLVLPLENWDKKPWSCLFCGYCYNDIDSATENQCQHVIYVIANDTLVYRSSFFSHLAGIKQFGRNRKYWNTKPFRSEGLVELIESVDMPIHIDTGQHDCGIDQNCGKTSASATTAGSIASRQGWGILLEFH